MLRAASETALVLLSTTPPPVRGLALGPAKSLQNFALAVRHPLFSPTLHKTTTLHIHSVILYTVCKRRGKWRAERCLVSLPLCFLDSL